VTQGHVADLVGHHARQLAHVGGLQDDGGVDVDVARRQRECVELLVVHYVEVVLVGLRSGRRHDLAPDLVDVPDHPLVSHEIELLAQLARRLVAELLLILRRQRGARGLHQHETAQQSGDQGMLAASPHRVGA
jgi:hypothetical protein